MPYLSVIVPAHNSGLTIEMCLKAIRQSTFQDYELIVVDGSSTDTTRTIAVRYANRLVETAGSTKRSCIRNCGIEHATGSIIVNVDSDVIIRPDTLKRIADYLSQRPYVYAVTGLLAKEHPHKGFFSQYKNLYMNYILSRLPEKVNFLYGSIHAFRRQGAPLYDPDIDIADDTALGQKLTAAGKCIAFIKDLDVIHMKKHSLLSLIKNDFRVPFDWAKIFLKYNGIKQLGRNKTGFAHSPKEQLISVVLAPLILLISILSLSGHLHFFYVFGLILIWSLLNIRFLGFLAVEKGIIFTICAFFVTFFDNIIMFLGIFCGFIISLIQGRQ